MPASTPPPAPPAPGRLTLFSLPDEILAEIFQHVHAAYQREKPGSPPLSYLLIHPRLNKLLWTIWDSVIVVPENAKAVDRFQARYTFRPSLLEHIQDLHIIMNSPCPARVVALFHRLSTVSNLKTLRIELTKAVLKSGWPPYDVILRMKSLQSCYLLGAGHGAEIKPDDSLRSTKSVAESQNLRRLRITLTHRSLDTASFCSKVLDCFASADLEHLELDLGSHLDLNALKIPWENLKRLTIRADWHLTSNKDYSRLTTRLAAFDQLTALTLVNLHWDSDVDLLDVEPPASKPSHYRRLPALYTFVQDVAESTNVLQLCISDDDGEDGSASARACELRFIRRLGEASFQVDRYTGGECRDHFPVAF
ncbi:hypothetical protein C6P46_003173 [Rhodotorula mucilaginosa]|uniref:Uncharacterized protein n=1 Tax=Rhodotorula mucilaginosa TaxID=5537 RepID=A0A9P6W4Y8_RHOMI|nr:hypothetical protein C6P46_003173 [Rhodotorula mucilaginosa]